MRILVVIAAVAMSAAPRPADSQPYVSAQLGLAGTDWPRGAPLNGTIDDRALAYGIDVGMGLGRRWGIELGAYGYGSFDARGTPCAGEEICPAVVTEIGGNDVKILKAALAPRFELGNVRLFGTFGVYRATIETGLDVPDAKSHDRGAVLGVGARWFFRDPWNISIQATRFDDNLRQLTLGVGWGWAPERSSVD